MRLPQYSYFWALLSQGHNTACAKFNCSLIQQVTLHRQAISGQKQRWTDRTEKPTGHEESREGKELSWSKIKPSQLLPAAWWDSTGGRGSPALSSPWASGSTRQSQTLTSSDHNEGGKDNANKPKISQQQTTPEGTERPDRREVQRSSPTTPSLSPHVPSRHLPQASWASSLPAHTHVLSSIRGSFIAPTQDDEQGWSSPIPAVRTEASGLWLLGRKVRWGTLPATAWSDSPCLPKGVLPSAVPCGCQQAPRPSWLTHLCLLPTSTNSDPVPEEVWKVQPPFTQLASGVHQLAGKQLQVRGWAPGAWQPFPPSLHEDGAWGCVPTLPPVTDTGASCRVCFGVVELYLQPWSGPLSSAAQSAPWGGDMAAPQRHLPCSSWECWRAQGSGAMYLGCVWPHVPACAPWS